VDLKLLGKLLNASKKVLRFADEGELKETLLIQKVLPLFLPSIGRPQSLRPAQR
jgi:hypothetical protein